jgi:hypothetical protein
MLLALDRTVLLAFESMELMTIFYDYRLWEPSRL